MSDRILLSLWFPTQSASRLLPRLAQAVAVLPAEALEAGVHQLSVTALAWSEPPLLELRFKTGITMEDALEQMREFVADDCACELECHWLLWNYANGGWHQTPQPIMFTVYGAAFDHAGDDPETAKAAPEFGHLVVDFGLDEAFLAELAPWDSSTRSHLQANILQLLAFAHKLQAQMEPQRRKLWSETEADWTQKLVRRLELAQALSAPEAPLQ